VHRPPGPYLDVQAAPDAGARRVRRQLPEIARIGASMATFPGIHLRLATGSSYLCGLQEQKERPEMARKEKIGGRATSGGQRRRPEHLPQPRGYLNRSAYGLRLFARQPLLSPADPF
jgi:hypothetical protein